MNGFSFFFTLLLWATKASNGVIADDTVTADDAITADDAVHGETVASGEIFRLSPRDMAVRTSVQT